ncbi:tautomerase [Marinobacterium nitratireducens]|uniref:Tautomerase n=1 Tax=Marinobacterium nitratireducens TaxID=518897 RepID=A0A918DU91_9GAMM|nr:2-hydroxymuconate tautomerase [Marinobacterium nitratireducens]GGO84163.1 tautomerase [Marinobacterium nitratireducens]
MPVIQVNMIEGRSEKQKEALIQELTEACYKAISAPHESVRVLINEIPKKHYGIGGKTAEKLGR